jgi:hypothetical protein
MYSLILVLATGVTTVGTYANVGDCQKHIAQFTQQDIKAACVQQQSPEEAMRQMQTLMNAFLK